jgi:hypothetical protein
MAFSLLGKFEKSRRGEVGINSRHNMGRWPNDRSWGEPDTLGWRE